MKKRILSFLLALSMGFCLIPATAFAEESVEEAGSVQSDSGSLNIQLEDMPDNKWVALNFDYVEGTYAWNTDIQIYKDGKLISSNTLTNLDVFFEGLQTLIGYAEMVNTIADVVPYEDLEEGTYTMTTHVTLFNMMADILASSDGPSYSFTVEKDGYYFMDNTVGVIRDEAGVGRSFWPNDALSLKVKVNGKLVNYERYEYEISDVISSNPGIMEIYKGTDNWGFLSFSYGAHKAGSASLTFKGTIHDKPFEVTLPVTVSGPAEPEKPIVPGTENHDFSVKNVTKATLTSNGKIVTKCKDCGEIKSTTTIYYPKIIKLSATAYTYDGNVKKPTVSVVGANGKTIAASNYTVTYASGRENVGSYTAKVAFKGNYSGTKSLTFKINPPKTALKTLTKGTKSFKATWTKKSTQVTGYQIQYSTSSTFASGNKTATVTSYKTVSKTIKSLKAKKKYYVRIRTYKTVSGVKYYSGWSAKKYVTTK